MNPISLNQRIQKITPSKIKVDKKGKLKRDLWLQSYIVFYERVAVSVPPALVREFITPVSKSGLFMF